MNEKRLLSGLILSAVCILGLRTHQLQRSNRKHVKSKYFAVRQLATKESISHEDREIFRPLLKLASAHFASQALNTAIILNIPNKLRDGEPTSLIEISTSIGDHCNKDALLRTLRLLTTIDVVEETELSDGSVGFSLTKLGLHLRSGQQSNPSMASCIQHWMERPLWNALLELPYHIREVENTSSPFERANEGISSDTWYNEQDHPESLRHANSFVRIVHKKEIEAVVNGIDWAILRGKRLLEIGGYHGNLIAAIANIEPSIECFCLDLPNVISRAPEDTNSRVTMVPGDIFDVSTIPACQGILMKHFLDRCMWNRSQTLEILRNCHSVLIPGGILVIAEAVLPNFGKVNRSNELELYMDALYMLVGREGQRTEKEWIQLGCDAGFRAIKTQATDVPSCSLIILEKF